MVVNMIDQCLNGISSLYFCNCRCFNVLMSTYSSVHFRGGINLLGKYLYSVHLLRLEETCHGVSVQLV